MREWSMKEQQNCNFKKKATLNCVRFIQAVVFRLLFFFQVNKVQHTLAIPIENGLD